MCAFGRMPAALGLSLPRTVHCAYSRSGRDWCFHRERTGEQSPDPEIKVVFLEEVVSKLRHNKMKGKEAGRGEVQVQNCVIGH